MLVCEYVWCSPARKVRKIEPRERTEEKGRIPIQMGKKKKGGGSLRKEG